ncbi:MAG: hypothetical protein J7L88_02070, partial [Thermoplasmata archaeon]|nr:hypothetical protein [Thermoplasmata archaeon]
MEMSTKELLQDKIFESGIKRRRTVFIIVILIVLLLAIYIFNMYLYSYEENYSLSANEVFTKEVEVKGVPHLKMPIKIFFQVSVQADIYLFSEEVYNKYHDKADFPERYAEDAISFVLEKKKMEVKLARPPGRLYIVVRMPGLDKVVNQADASLYVEYKPLDPIYPITALIEVVAIPLLILRIYILGQKIKQLRMQLTLDLDSLSD